MAKRKWTPEERDAFRRQRAEWERERRDFAAMVERLHARWSADDERRARRLRLVRRLVPFRRAA